MEYSRDLAQKWQYVKEDNKLPYDTFALTDEYGFIIAKSIQDEEVATSIVHLHNINIK